MDDLKPLKGLTKVLIRMLWIYAFILACAVIADFYWWIEYSRLPPDRDISEVFVPSDIINALVSLLQTGFFIATAVFFLKWIYRINKNLGVLSSTRMEFTPGWSVGWYFIPLANLFKPYQAMKEIWVTAHREWTAKSSILGWWWFLWLISTYVSSIAGNLILKAETIDAYTASLIAYIISDGLDIVLTIVALLLIRQISTAYEKNYGADDRTEGDLAVSEYARNLGAG